MIGFVFTIRAHPILASLQTAGVTLGIFGVLGVMTFFSFWFGFLVAFSRRKASPVRLFLDGLLLPTVTVSIIAFAMERIVRIPEDLPHRFNRRRRFRETRGTVIMTHPTDRRSIVANLVWGILMICLVSSPRGASGQTVLAQDVEGLDVWTRLTWTLRMVVAPGTLAHVRTLYAYDPEKLEGRTVHPDRIGRVATVSTCRSHQMEELVGWTPQTPEQNNVFWCARYMSKLLDAFRSAYRQRRAATPGSDGQQQTDIVYFATTYPLPGVEPDKRFVVELR